MSSLSQLLSKPISWKAAAADPNIKAFLEDLQANIMKGHGRHHSVHVFMSFAGMAPVQAAKVVRALGESCTSAYEQLLHNKRLPPFLDGGTIRCCFLSSTGYRALGKALPASANGAFANGMDKRANILTDPERAKWDPEWVAVKPDAMFLIANANAAMVEAELETVVDWLVNSDVTVTATERGLQQTRRFRPDVDEGVEHFGYVDGRSQPLFLEEDIEEESVAKGGWDFRFPPSQFIVPDPNGVGDFAAGSYFVFRKLEQNVRGFNAAEEALGRALFNIPSGNNLTPKQRELLDQAGAMVVGRFEDGTPLTSSNVALSNVPPNNFDYASDANGGRCPFHAHIRKVNPRGDIERQLDNPDPMPGRKPIMARRGITYGPRRPHSPDKSEFADAGREPEKGVGLLFMAYMASIEDQFEFTQQSWANNRNFVGNLTGKGAPNGIDPIIGQTNSATDRDHAWRDGFTPGSQPATLPFEQFVTMKGGEYFFAPSLNFLRSL